MLLTDSIKTLLGKQVKILFKNVVRLETKGDKTENRVLVSVFEFFYCVFYVLNPCFRCLCLEILYLAPLISFVLTVYCYVDLA